MHTQKKQNTQKTYTVKPTKTPKTLIYKRRYLKRNAFITTLTGVLVSKKIHFKPVFLHYRVC